MDMCYKPLETCLKYRATEGCMTLPPLIVAVQVNLWVGCFMKLLSAL